MHFNIVAFAVPLFLLFIALEYVYTKRRGKNYFQFAESVANLNVGICERLLDVFTTALFFYWFDFVYRHFALFTIKPGFWGWLALFLLTDLVWYWYHRLAHEINVFWAVHVVHHQSEDFNYTVSARITVFQALVRCGFWSVLPLLGFPAPMITVFLLIHGLYPFFIHTQAIGKLGWLEYILVTPSHHRVHHSSNPEYLDKNYGDVLIIWDKLFGTFTEEKTTPVYGLTKNLNSYSFLWQHFHFPLELAYACKKAKSFKQVLRILFGKPDDLDPNNRDVLERALLSRKPQLTYTPQLKRYVTVQTAISIVVLFGTALLEHYLTAIQLWIISAFIILSLINTGAILEQKQWILYLEYARLLTVALAVLLYFPGTYTVTALLAIGLLLILMRRPAKRYYFNLLYSA